MALVQLAACGFSPVVDSSGNARPALAFTLTNAAGAAVPIYADAGGATALVTADKVTGARGTLPGYAAEGTYTFGVDGVTETVEVVSAARFVAPGNGVASDRARIVAAIAALPAGGGEVRLGAGTYVVESAIPVAKNGVRIVGEGALATVVKYTGSSGFCFDLSVSGYQVLQDFGIDGSLSSVTAGALRLQSGVTRVKCVRVRFLNFAQTAYPVELVGALDNTFLNCGWSANAVHLRLADNTALVNPPTYPSNQNTFRDCTFEGATWAAGAAVVVQDSEGNLFDGCLVQGNMSGNTFGVVNTAAGYATGRANELRSCWFEENGITRPGVGTAGSHGIHISGTNSTTRAIEGTIIRDCKFFSAYGSDPATQIYLSNAIATLIAGGYSNLGSPNKAVEHGAGVTLTRLLANDFAGTVPGANVSVWP